MSIVRRFSRIAALAGVVSAIAIQGAAAQDAQTLRIRSLAASCAQCHGTDGHVVQGSALAGLAGTPAPQFIERMNGFKSGARVGTVMPQIAKGFSDEQIARLAGYFAAQPLDTKP
jgi:sulfide dehydrogenase cytochrome subunit